MLYLVLTDNPKVISEISGLRRGDKIYAKGYWLNYDTKYSETGKQKKYVFSVDPPKPSKFIYINHIFVNAGSL